MHLPERKITTEYSYHEPICVLYLFSITFFRKINRILTFHYFSLKKGQSRLYTTLYIRTLQDPLSPLRIIFHPNNTPVFLETFPLTEYLFGYFFHIKNFGSSDSERIISFFLQKWMIPAIYAIGMNQANEYLDWLDNNFLIPNTTSHSNETCPRRWE